MKVLGENLKRLRKAKGWTQAQVAQCIHVDRTTYTKYESGAVEPPLLTCVRLCMVLDTDMKGLLGWMGGVGCISTLPREELLTEEEKQLEQERLDAYYGDPAWDLDRIVRAAGEAYSDGDA